MTVSYAPFDGDGRTKIVPTADLRKHRPEASPMAVTRGQARRIIDHFWDKGRSTHSAMAATLWVVEVWAYHQKIPIKVIKHPLGGWMARLEEKEEAACESP